MTNQEYANWSSLHAKLFGMAAAEDASLFKLWAPVLAAFSFEELRAASYCVAQDPSDRRRWRENHLAMLREAVTARRAEAAAKASEQFDRQVDASTCENCQGVGVVRVPDAKWIVDAELQQGFFVVVACTCDSGAARFNAISVKLNELQDRRRFLDLRHYELSVPDWREIIAAYESARAHRFEAGALARRADATVPIMMEAKS